VSRETKIGLLVATGIILTFAFILQMQLAGEPLAPIDDNLGVHVSTPPRPSQGPGGSPVPPQRVAGDGARTAPGTLPSIADGGAMSVDSPDESAEEIGQIVVDRGADSGGHDDRVAEVGQGDGRDEAANRPARETVAPVMRPYTVVAGDSLYRIAEKTFGPGKGGQWQRIADANPELRDPKRLRAGMKIVIPSLEPPAAPQADRLADGRTELAPVAPTAQTYVVQAGDTLGSISQKVLGTSRKWQLISKANGNLDPASLRIGQTLTIPQDQPQIAQSDTSSLERALEEAAGFVSDSRRPTGVYRVQAGDSLYAISRRVFSSGDRWKEIYELNREKMSSPNDLVVGQVILVPALGQVAMTESPLH
jgi:nucleoid-associated protein YgaU